MKEIEVALRKEISVIVRKILNSRAKFTSFQPGKEIIRYAAAVYDHEEIENMINTILDGWFGAGKNVTRFENQLSRFLKTRKTVMTNSGSSSNLLAISALTSAQLNKDIRIKMGDEIITTALTFPTTINPIIQNGLIPVLVDIDLNTYNISYEELENALSDKTRALFISHTLGNPNKMDFLTDFVEDHDLFLIEDACDALGSKYNGKYLGSFGVFGTFSFYPAHHITTGEGGAIVTDNDKLGNIARSLRDWGRSCSVPVCDPLHCPEKDCPKSANYKASSASYNLPEDYDKRYTYTNIGYNLKPTEIQASMGLAQLKKLPTFIKSRNKNFNLLYEEFEKYEDHFHLPQVLPKSEPCWFAFPLTVKNEASFKRKDFIQWLIRHRIEVRTFFAGNITKHPAYEGTKYRVATNLANSDYVMYNSFFLGIYPGLSEEKMEYVISVIKDFMKKVR